MSIRAYLLIDVVDNLDQQQFVKILRELESMQGIEFVDPVSGDHDIVAIAETRINLESLVAKMWAKGWLKTVKVLPITSVFGQNGKLKRSWL